MTKYLYNGIELPALPEYPTDLNGNTMSYVVIEVKSDGSYWVSFSGQPITFDGTEFVVNLPRAWGYIENDAWVTDLAFGGYYTFNNCVWSNHNILNEDGTIYLAASTPIPVNGYEAHLYNGTWQKGTFYKRVNNAWVKHQAYKRQNGAWVKVKE